MFVLIGIGNAQTRSTGTWDQDPVSGTEQWAAELTGGQSPPTERFVRLAVKSKGTPHSGKALQSCTDYGFNKVNLGVCQKFCPMIPDRGPAFRGSFVLFA